MLGHWFWIWGGAGGIEGGSSVTISIVAVGAGVKEAAGGSSVGVSAVAVGVGVKEGLGGTDAVVAIVVTGGGENTTAEYHEDGSATIVLIVADGDGQKEARAPPANVDVEIVVTGAGTREAAGGSQASVVVSASGTGSKEGFGGSNDSVSIIATGAGVRPTVTTSGTVSPSVTEEELNIAGRTIVLATANVQWIAE